MTDKQKHAEQRVRAAVKYVKSQWGNGFYRLGDNMQEALVRAEVLAEISRLSAYDTDAEAYRNLVDALAVAAVRWQREEAAR